MSSHSRREIQRRQRLWLRVHWRLVAAACVGALVSCGALWVADRLGLLPGRALPYLHGATAVSGVWLVYVLMVQSGGIASKQVGVLAETWTAAALSPLQRSGWRLAHDVVMEHTNLDHALIGPGGIVAVETKFRADWSEVTDDQLAAMARQARRQARDLSFRIGLMGRGVTPLIAVWSSGVSGVLDSEFERGGVRFCPARDLRSAIEAMPTTIDPVDVEHRFALLDAYMTNRSKGLDEERGPTPRTVGEIYNDVCFVALTALTVVFVVLSSLRVRPVGIWAAALALAIAGVSWWLRRRAARMTRLRVCATAAIASALGLVVTGSGVAAILLLNR